MSVNCQENSSLGGESSISDGNSEGGSIDLPLVHIADHISLVGNNKEEAALLGGRKSIRNNVKLDSHKGNVIPSCDVGHTEGHFLELSNSDNAIVSVEVVALSAGAA